MGMFSWVTSDTKRAIVNNAYGTPFTVFMTAPDGRQWREDDYEGYGVFGGKDIYALIAELNCPDDCFGNEHRDRALGINLVHCEANPGGDFALANNLHGLKLPRLTEKEVFDVVTEPYPECDPGQGFGEEDAWEEEFDIIQP